jgi:hypothetical protein
MLHLISRERVKQGSLSMETGMTIFEKMVMPPGLTT